MLVEFTKENAEKCKALLAKLFAEASKHRKPALVGDAAVIESFLTAAGEAAEKANAPRA